MFQLKSPLSRYKISGHSMEKTLLENQVVWVNHWAYLFSQPKVGDIVVFEYQGKDLLKRVIKTTPGFVEVAGDNQKDSLRLGEISLEKIRGKVI